MHDTPEKLSLLRGLMEQGGVHAYIIPDTDPHLGEYVPDHWRILQWLTGFTGSAGTLVITQAFAGFWTDSRYLVQAENQLTGTGIELMQPEPGKQAGYSEWLSLNLEPRSTIGLDGKIFSINVVRKLKRLLEEKNITLDIECDLISQIWEERPPLPADKAFDHPLAFAGKERNRKIREVRDEMEKYKIEFHLLTSPDDIMWLLNIRGRDVKYSPLLMSFAVIDPEQVLLFADEDKIPYTLAREFDKLGIILLPYEEAAGMLTTLKSDTGILISPSTTSAALYSAIPARLKIREDLSIPSRLKAVKNTTEISCLSRTMVRDGVALTKFFFAIEHDRVVENLSELSLSNKIDHLRSEQENYISPSFPTIVAYNEHGALPHYTASATTNSVIGGGGILLVDSGGQYLDGTTDITRTICLGSASGKQKKDFTLVLKGMISLASAVFPAGTFGYQLDVLARKNLWDHGLSYGHGTGHGVGYCLNVHEGPHRISAVAGTDAGSYLRPGNVVSDEPAIYRKGEYGIRTENLLLCYEDEETEFGKFNRFSTLSLCYIDTMMIELSLLDDKEIKWLNSYHADVYEKLSPHLTPEEREWLAMKTQPLGLKTDA